MSALRPNQFFIKTFRNFIFAFLIILLQLTLSLTQDGRDSIQLPPLANDAEKLAALLQIKEKVPNLFSDAAKYDIDLFAILDDEEKLLNHLKSNPKYLELFQFKKYYEIKITPPREGLQVGEVSIDPLAIQEWKEQLKKKLNQFKSQWEVRDENSNPLDRIKSEISLKVQRMTEANSSLDGNALVRDLGKIKVNQAILNPALKKSGAKTLSERLSTVLKVYDQLPEKPASVSSEKLAQALMLEQDREDLKSFLELHSVLNRGGQNLDPSHLNWQTVEESLNELGSQDLIPLQDNDDYLRPIVHQLISSSHPELQEEMLKRIHKNISSFASRTIRTDKKAIDPVTISQQHPIVGIFRGCTGGDCSSQYSFPYPNDPNEKVFFISDKDKKVKGYVSATQVMASGKPSLYVITVSGNRVTAADTELILRGLEKEKANLGVEQILLPAPDKIGSLINFPAPRSVYERYAAHQPTIPIQYDHPEIRNDIQSYQSKKGYNRGHYDHMDQNGEAVILNFKKNLGNDKISTQTHELPTASLQAPPLNSTSVSEIFEFLLDLKRSGRRELEKKVLEIDHIKQSLNQEKYQQLTHFLSKGPSEKPMTVQIFKTMLTSQLKELDSSLSQYLDKNPSLVYPTVFFCSDAFSAENIDETAKYFLKRIKEEANRNFNFDESKLSQIIEKHILDLNNTERVREFKDEMFNHLQDPDSTARKKALDSLAKIRANDPHIQLSISQLALQDADKSVRHSALTALLEIKPTDSKVHSEISKALQDADEIIKIRVLDLLGAIKPTDPKIHSEISKALQDADELMKIKVLDALGAIKPADPKIHSEISKALQDDDEVVRHSALTALGEVKPTDPKIHAEILHALQDSSSLVRECAFATLGAIKPADPKIHTEIAKVLQDADENVRKSALDALGAIKPVDPKIQTEIVKALQDADEEVRRSALDALGAIKPTDPNIHSKIAKALQDSGFFVRESALTALGAIKPTDPKIHLEILKVALRDSIGFFRKLAIKSLEKIKSSSSEVSKGLLQIAIYRTDLEERTLAIQALGEMDLSNRSIHESLRSEILKNSIELNHRQDLLPLIQKIMIPFRQTESVNENYCQSLNDILSHDKNLKSLMEFFSNHSGALGVSRSLFEKIGEDGDLLPTPPLSTQAHFNPPSAPER